MPPGANNGPYERAQRTSGRRNTAVVLGLLLLGGIGAGVLAVSLLGDDETTTASEETSTIDSATFDDPASADVAPAGPTGFTGDSEATVTTDEANEAVSEPVSTSEASTDVRPSLGRGTGPDSGRQAEFRDGKLYLTGKIPDAAFGEAIVARLAVIAGPENIINEYVVDPTVVVVPGQSTPLTISDTLQFDTGSTRIDPNFRPFLDLLEDVLSSNPQVTVTVITHTDASGSAESNLRLAAERAFAVQQYLYAKGADLAQIRLDPRGEEGASEGDSPEEAAQQRRAEFVVTGFAG